MTEQERISAFRYYAVRIVAMYPNRFLPPNVRKRWWHLFRCEHPETQLQRYLTDRRYLTDSRCPPGSNPNQVMNDARIARMHAEKSEAVQEAKQTLDETKS